MEASRIFLVVTKVCAILNMWLETRGNRNCDLTRPSLIISRCFEKMSCMLFNYLHLFLKKINDLSAKFPRRLSRQLTFFLLRPYGILLKKAKMITFSAIFRVFRPRNFCFFQIYEDNCKTSPYSEIKKNVDPRKILKFTFLQKWHNVIILAYEINYYRNYPF